MTIINFYGAPGSGKSTAAAACYAYLSQRGHLCELVTETAKDFVWEGKRFDAATAFELFGKQTAKLLRVASKVDFLITDSPLFLAAFYAYEYDNLDFLSIAKQADKLFDTNQQFNIFFDSILPYKTIGRNESAEQAQKLSQNLESFLIDECGLELHKTDAKRFNVAQLLGVKP